MKTINSRPARAGKNSAFVVAGGSSEGLGRATAIRAALAGYPVALLGRSAGNLKEAQAEVLRATGSKARVSIHRCDLTNEAQVKRAFGEVRRTHGGLSVLMNNAATWITAKSIEETDVALLRKSLDLNFFSAFNASKAALKLKSGSGLAIINIGATASLQGWPGVLPFCLGKGALRTFSQALAREHGPKGVHVAHLIIDGLIDNPRTRKLNKKMPGNRFINMESLAAEILHVAEQDESCWTFEWDARPYNENW